MLWSSGSQGSLTIAIPLLQVAQNEESPRAESFCSERKYRVRLTAIERGVIPFQIQQRTDSILFFAITLGSHAAYGPTVWIGLNAVPKESIVICSPLLDSVFMVGHQDSSDRISKKSQLISEPGCGVLRPFNARYWNRRKQPSVVIIDDAWIVLPQATD